MDSLLPWFILKAIPGIGNILIKRLIAHFKTPSRILAASAQQLAQVEGVSLKLAGRLLSHAGTNEAKRELDLFRKHNFQMVPFTAPDYPPLLREIPDPPPYLYVHGHLLDTDRSISIVGSRRATAYGITVTRRLAEQFSDAGITVVSGLARGIDTAAHEGALSGKGMTLAVLGSGLLNVYPRENRRLARHIAQQGAVISEFPLLADPEAHHFPVRNRIISGISRGTVVVEAARKSGSLITARLALEQDREVFAVPGSIQSFKSGGTHALIKQGAKLIDSATDVLEDLSQILCLPETGKPTAHVPAPKDPLPSHQETRILQRLSAYPVHIDELIRDLNIPSGKLSGALLALELKGCIRQVSANNYVKNIP